MVTYMLRIAVDPGQWNPRRLKWSFWLWNVGLAVMVFGSVLPVGFLQLETAFTAGYDAARSLAFYNRDLIQLLFWARLPGDTMIILGTAVFAYDTVLQRFALRDTSIPASVPGSSVISSRVLPEDD
jgi:nitric oxide reductase subunit B